MKVVAFERSVQGTGASRRLRNSGKTPGIIYGGQNTPQVVELDHNALFHALRKEAFHSSILEIEIGGKAQKVLLRDYQMHPFKPLVLHIDFQRVSASEKIHMRIPLHFTRAEESTAIKLGGAVISHIANGILKLLAYRPIYLSSSKLISVKLKLVMQFMRKTWSCQKALPWFCILNRKIR